jgi:hypothetical protein
MPIRKQDAWGAFSLLVAVLVMAVAAFAVPFPGSLVFLVAVGAGVGLALWKVWRT